MFPGPYFYSHLFCYTVPQVIYSSEIHGAINFYSLFFTIFRSKYRKERLERGRGKRDWEVKILPKPPDRRGQRRGRECLDGGWWLPRRYLHLGGSTEALLPLSPAGKSTFSQVHSSVFSAKKKMLQENSKKKCIFQLW